MACGTPVVATMVDGLKDTVIHGQTGYLVPEGDPQKMAAAVCSLLGDRAASSAFGEAGRVRALDFEFDRVSPMARNAIASAMPAGGLYGGND
jgi:D-inositol-3-phosphate glycosyltransferase